MKRERPSWIRLATPKWLLSIGFIFASLTYVGWQDANSEVAVMGRPTPFPFATSTTEKNSAPATEPPKPQKTAPTQAHMTMPMQTTSMHTAMTKTYNDGSFIGAAADAYYGMVQVKATIQNDKLVGVTFLQYPNDRDTSRFINSQAMPLLIQEAIQAQSARVDGVSGATETSGAFIESLTSALNQAKA